MRREENKTQSARLFCRGVPLRAPVRKQREADIAGAHGGTPLQIKVIIYCLTLLWFVFSKVPCRQLFPPSAWIVGSPPL